MEKILGRELDLSEVEDRIIENFAEVFDNQIQEKLAKAVNRLKITSKKSKTGNRRQAFAHLEKLRITIYILQTKI